MINHLRHMAVFAKVVEEGTFRAAAKNLGLAPSRVSQTISDLESYLGITLFYRTTRKLVLTNEGKEFYSHISNMVQSAESGLNKLNALSKKPTGELKVSIPSFLEGYPLSPAIADFIIAQPEVSLSLRYTDQTLDILGEGLDLCICAGVGGIDDSAMMSRKLGKTKRKLITSNIYFNKKPYPKHPSELQDWCWISSQTRPNIIELSSSSGESATISESSRINASSVNAIKHLAHANMGITVLPENIVSGELEKGTFIHVLPEWEVQPIEYYAIWPDKSRRENLTMIFVRHLVKHLEAKKHVIHSAETTSQQNIV